MFSTGLATCKSRGSPIFKISRIMFVSGTLLGRLDAYRRRWLAGLVGRNQALQLVLPIA
jgi:hypothetical protein